MIIVGYIALTNQLNIKTLRLSDQIQCFYGEIMLARSRWDDNSDKTKAGNIRNVVRSQTDVSKRRKKKKKNKTKGPWHGNRYLSKPTPTIRQVRQFLLFPLSIKLFYSAIFFFREKNKKQEIKKADLVCKPFPSHCCPHFLSIKLFY